MFHGWRRFVAALLAAAVLFSTVPTQAIADTILENTPEENERILDELEGIVGSEDEAERYYALLEQYGFLDEDGNPVESWEITMDGEDVTAEEVRALLEGGDYDPAKVVIVDGTTVTLGDLDTMIQIEDYVARLRDTYFTDHEWTEEQTESLASLAEQMSTKGIQVTRSSGNLVFPSGTDHDQRVTVPESVTVEQGSLETCSATITVELDHTAKQPVTLKWRVVRGTSDANDQSGELTFSVGESPRKNITVTCNNSSYYSWNGLRTVVVEYEMVSGALFSNGLTGASTVINVENDMNLDNYFSKVRPYALNPDFNNDGRNDIPNVNQIPDEALLFGAWLPGASSPDLDSTKYGGIDNWLTVKFENEAQPVSVTNPGKNPLHVVAGDADNTATSAEFDFTWSGLGNSTDGTKRNVLYSYELTAQLSNSDNGNRTTQCILKFPYETFPNSTTDCIKYGVFDKLYVEGEYTYTQGNGGVDVTTRWGDDVLFSDSSSTPAGSEESFQFQKVIDPDDPDWREEIPLSFNLRGRSDLTVTIRYVLVDEMDPVPGLTSVPEGTFLAGQKIPINVFFDDKPVYGEGLSLVVNGRELQSQNAGGDTLRAPFDYKHTFLYEVGKTDGLGIRTTELSGLVPYGRETPMTRAFVNEILSPDRIVIPKSLAVDSLSAEIGGTSAEPVFNVNLTFSDDESLTRWLGSEFLAKEDGTFESTTLKARYGDSYAPFVISGDDITGATATASFAIGPNTGTANVTHLAEVYLEDQVIHGFYITAEQLPVTYVSSGNLSAAVAVLKGDGSGEEYAPVNGLIYPDDGPLISVTSTVTGDSLTWADTDKVTTGTLNVDGTVSPDDVSAHFAWVSTNTDVANVDAAGRVTPTGSGGDVAFRFVALNGGVSGKQAYAETEVLSFGVGLTPFLMIPNKTVTVREGQDAVVLWSSNISDKNGENPTSFSIALKKNGETVGLPPEVATVAGTAAAPAARVVIPAALLSYTYGDDGANEYKVTVSSVFGGKTYSASATITLSPQPAVVTLGDLPSYYVTDAQGSVDISWAVEHLARYEEGTDNLFEFKITKDGQESPVATVEEPGQGGGDGTYAGSYRLTNIDVAATSADPNSYRDVYTVTVRAKNGSDSTWSFDSFILYVYDADALQIMVDGSQDDTLTMSNRELIAGMTQEKILEMGRDIHLRNVITANYGEYAWAELADQIEWASSNPEAATLNYQQGTLYEDIRNLSYTSYRPTSDFVISGLGDGETTITARHKLTGLTDTLPVKVETLENHLYLFQCYPQGKVTLTFSEYADASCTTVKDAVTRIESEENGAAAYYSEFGIASDVYCSSTVDGSTYLGTFFQNELETGEGDSTKLELYPCNNLDMRRAAYAYLYIKKPDGTPYQGDVTFRGGVYVDGEYQERALFGLNGGATVSTEGDQDTTVTLGADGKLEVKMDQSQWNVDDLFGADIEYVFQVEQGGNGGGTDYYPLLVTIDATVNEDALVGTGEAIVSLRENENPGKGRAPFVAAQVSSYENYGTMTNLMGETGAVGPSDSCPEAVLNTVVMWWGDEMPQGDPANSLRLVTGRGVPYADGEGESSLSNTAYPFSDILVTQYTVNLNAQSLEGVLDSGRSASAVLEYYRDGKTLYRREELSFDICNMLGKGAIEDQASLLGQLQDMGKMANTDVGPADIDFGDISVEALFRIVETDTYTTGDDKLLSLQVAPTSDPRKFLGFVEVNIGNMSDKNQITGVYAVPGQERDIDYEPGIGEIMMFTMLKKPKQYGQDQIDDFNRSKRHEGVRNISFDLGGYAECLIYLSEVTGNWEMQILNGGFNAGGGVSYTWNFNTMVGLVPFTASLTTGGVGEVSMDVLTSAWKSASDASVHGLGNDFLTELRLYLYLRFFAGVGWDYAIIAAKLGFFGQINLDMRFDWLNRPYLYDQNGSRVNVADGGTVGTLNGQSFKLDGQAGMEMVFRFLFVSYEEVLFTKAFKVFDETTGEWTTIQTNWDKNQKAQHGLIEGLADNGSLSLMSVGDQQIGALNLAPTVESRDYLENGSSNWVGGGGFQLFSLDEENGLETLEENTYAYANPVVTDDGELLVYLTHQDSKDVEKTRVAYATSSGESYVKGDIVSDGGFGDSQVSVDGTGGSAVAAWTRQGKDINKDSGAVLTGEDQLMMLDNADVYAGIWDGKQWSSVLLSESDSADLAPVVATNGKEGDELRAVVAWRSVSSSGAITVANGAAQTNATNFDQRDAIVYKMYDGSKAYEENGGWSELKTLYNGTSGGVKAIVAEMLDDGTAAVAYTLDTDNNDSTITDREIAYAVIDAAGCEVVRSVEATKDAYLDENPQITAVTFPGANDEQRFVLGWYSEQSTGTDVPAVLDGGASAASDERVSDIRLVDFDRTGAAGQLLPDSISEVSDAGDVSITSNFRFAKNATSVEDLSILWVERAQVELQDVGAGDGQGSRADADDLAGLGSEHDVLRSVKFYASGQNDEIVRITDVVDVAEMGESTSIDHFDAYVSDAEKNQVKAVILGTTYGEGGETVEKTGETVGGDTVRYAVPKQTYGMYTATQSYSNGIEVTGVAADYETVRRGAATQIQFMVKNTGIHAVNRIEICVGEDAIVYGDGDEELNLMPGESIQLSASYDVPANTVEDPDYTVKATFNLDEGATGSADVDQPSETGFLEGIASLFGGAEASVTSQVTGTVYLALPDLEVTDARIVEEAGGERTIQVKLNNDSDSLLKGSGRTVRLGFYADSTYEVPLTNVSVGGTALSEGTYAISEDEALGMIDEGGYALQARINAKAYVGEDAAEIPETGIPVYIRAEVIESQDADEGKGEVLADIVPSNNYGVVTVENLATRTGEDVSVDTVLANENGAATVTVSLRNNTLSQKATGNLIVTLLDAEGNVIAEQQSYVPVSGDGSGNGLITLSGEESQTCSFTFTGEGVENAADVRVTYSDARLDDGNANLASVSADGVELSLDEPTGTWSGKTALGDLAETLLTIVPENPDATVTVNGQPYDKALRTALSRGQNRFDVVVTAPGTGEDGQPVTKAYSIVIENGSAPSGGGPAGYEVSVPESVPHGTVSVSPERAQAGQTVTVAATPDEGYVVGAVTVTGADGAAVEVTDNGDGTWSFAMPAGGASVSVTFLCDGGALCPSRRLADVAPGAWYHEAVDWAVSTGAMTGYGHVAAFGVPDPLSRAQLAQVLWNRAGRPEADASAVAAFPDCDPGAFYAEAVAWCASEGLMTGYEDGAFGPADDMTREQLATVLWRLGGSPEADADLSAFPDAGSVSEFAEGAMRWAVSVGAISGQGSDGTLDPVGALERAQCATVLYRLYAVE